MSYTRNETPRTTTDAAAEATPTSDEAFAGDTNIPSADSTTAYTTYLWTVPIRRVE